MKMDAKEPEPLLPFYKRWWKRLFGKEEKKELPPKDTGGGMKVDLERVLQRLDPNNVNIPNAVRANAIRTLTGMAGKEITLAAGSGDLKRANKVNEALQQIETKFPKALDSLSKEDKSAFYSQKDRTASRIARINNTLQNTNGEASAYGSVPDPKTQERRGKLK